MTRKQSEILLALV